MIDNEAGGPVSPKEMMGLFGAMAQMFGAGGKQDGEPAPAPKTDTCAVSDQQEPNPEADVPGKMDVEAVSPLKEGDEEVPAPAPAPTSRMDSDREFRRKKFDVSMSLTIAELENVLNMLWLEDVFPVIDDNGRWHLERGASLV